MKYILVIIFTAGMLLLFNSCTRKTHPGNSTTGSVKETVNKPVAVKPVTTVKMKTAIPKVIAVNDNVASKTFDGKYYYDLEGRRYWKNYKDGKYYLFNKSMASNPDFKKPR